MRPILKHSTDRRTLMNDKHAAMAGAMIIGLIITVISGALVIQLGSYSYYSVQSNLPALDSADYNDTITAVNAAVKVSFTLSPTVLTLITISAIIWALAGLGGMAGASREFA